MSYPSEGLDHFSRSEFDHPDHMDSRILVLIDKIRERSGVRIKITSDYRSREEHELIYPDPNSRPDSPHTRGVALDFKPVPFDARARLVVLAAITGLFVEGAAPGLGLEIADRHFHIDLDVSGSLRRPHIWIGRSK